MMKNEPIVRHPLYTGENALDFGLDIDVTELTPEQKTDAFLSKYQRVVDPIVTYDKYFKSSAKGIDHIFRDVKLYYKKLVVEGTWSERKYVAVLDDIFTNRTILTVATLDFTGLRYDNGTLNSQRSKQRRK